MNAVKLKIMTRATSLRLAAGEALEDILASWPALTESDKEQIKAAAKEGAA